MGPESTVSHIIMKKIIIAGSGLGFLVPLFAFAQTISTILGTIQGILNVVMPILITIGVVYFVWNVIQFALTGDAEKKEQAQEHMIRGIIALFVILAIWGLIAVLFNTFGISQQGLGGGQSGQIPCVIDTTPGDPTQC